MLNITNEISRTPPPGTVMRFRVGGLPILYAYGCALLENDTGDYYIYHAVNLDTGKSEVMSRRVTPLTTREVEKISRAFLATRWTAAISSSRCSRCTG